MKKKRGKVVISANLTVALRVAGMAKVMDSKRFA